MPCEFYERLAAGPLDRLLTERGDRFFKVVKLLAGGLPLVSTLAEVAELVADLSRPGLAGELVELIKAAKSAGQCDEEVKKAAERLGVGEEWLRTLAQNLAALSEIDIAELEERLRRLSEGLELLRRLSPHVLDLGQMFVEEDGRLFVRSPFGVVEYVEVGVEDKVRQALSHGRVVVVYGPRGVGKSTTALKAIYDFAKAQSGRAVVVVRVGEDWKETLRAAARLRDGPLVPVLYYDTLEVEGYKRRGEGVDVMYSAMAHAKPLADFLHDAALLGVPTVVVLAEEDYRAYEDVVERVGAEAVHLGGEAETLVRGILRGVPDAVAEAVLERYGGEFYAVVAALAKALYEEWRDPARVAEAVKRLDVHFLALAYLWHVVLGGDEEAARRAEPLILATGLFGPHPPKLAKAVIRAFDKEPNSAVVKWLSQPLHGTLYEAIRNVSRRAVYGWLGVRDDELCQGNEEGTCRLVEICGEVLDELSCEKCNTIADVEEEYAKWAAKRFVNVLIRDFLQAFNGVSVVGRWRIRYEVKALEGVKTVEDVVDELDILTALLGLAILPGWYSQLERLKGWFFVGGKKMGIVGLYLYPLLRERSGELVKRAVAIVHDTEKRGHYTDMDIWRAVGIAVAGQWDNATDEEVEKAVKLATFSLVGFATATPKVLENLIPLLSETWRRVMGRRAFGDGGRRQKLADWLSALALNAARGHPHGLLYFFTIGVNKPDPEIVTKRFDTLYNAVSNAGKLLLLVMLLYTLDWYIGNANVTKRLTELLPQSSTGNNTSRFNVVATLLGKPQSDLWIAFEEVAKRIERFVFYLDGIERTYVVAHLYPRLAIRYASFGELDKALKIAEDSLKALDELRRACKENRSLMEEKLQPYLELEWLKPNLSEVLDELSLLVYSHVAHVYKDVDELDKAMDYAEEACKTAKKLGKEYYEVSSCSLLPRLKAVRDDVLTLKELLIKEFERLWQRASQTVVQLGAETLATLLGKYVVALASAGRLEDVKKVLEEWGWALELHPTASALTYGVLSLYDEQYLDKALRHLPEIARANLRKFAKIMKEVIEKKGVVPDKYGMNVKNALREIKNYSDKLLLSVLVGLFYCKRGAEWGLNLARTAARAGSQQLKSIGGRLFGELAKALVGVKVGNCITDEVLKAVYMLYYYHI